MKFIVKADESHPAREEVLTFSVDGVQVEAIATSTFREVRIHLTLPFLISGEAYGIGFRPLLLCLKAAVNARQARLISLGLTDRDDCLRMAADLYHLHRTRLAISGAIEKAQTDYQKTREGALEQAARNIFLSATKLETGAASLRVQLDRHLITPRKFHVSMAELRRRLRSDKKLSCSLSTTYGSTLIG